MKKRILCFGDSNTWAYKPSGQPDNYLLRFDENERYTGILQNKLGQDYVVIEEGFNGRTTVFEDSESPYRNGLDFLPALLMTHMPLDLVTIMLGTNDIKNRICADSTKITAGMEQLVKAVATSGSGWQGKQPKILVISPILIGENIGDTQFSDEFDGKKSYEISKELAIKYEEMAKANGCEFLDASKVASAGEDAIHLDSEGHVALADNLYKIIKIIIG